MEYRAWSMELGVVPMPSVQQAVEAAEMPKKLGTGGCQLARLGVGVFCAACLAGGCLVASLLLGGLPCVRRCVPPRTARLVVV